MRPAAFPGLAAARLRGSAVLADDAVGQPEPGPGAPAGAALEVDQVRQRGGQVDKRLAGAVVGADAVRDLDVDLAYRFIRDTVWVAVRWYRPDGGLSAETFADQYLAILLDGIATARQPKRKPARPKK